MWKKLSDETKLQCAIQMVIMDAMEKGQTNKDSLLQYMRSSRFEDTVMEYISLMNKQTLYENIGS